MKTVLFALNSSYSHTNLAVRAIGSALRAAGEEVALIERSLRDMRHETLHMLYAEGAEVYGFSVYIWNAEEMAALAAELKTLLPEAVIVFGGPEVSFADDHFFDANPFVDHIIAGEGEEAFPALVRALAVGETPPRLLHAPPFSAFAESGIYYDEIGDPPQGLVYYESVRGCPFSCAYCLSSVSEGIRAKTAEHALSDLLAFERFEGIRTVKLVDRTFNFDRERAKTIWRALSGAEYTKEYHFEVSAALLDEESFAVLAAAPAGKFRLEIGVQSTNPETVKTVSRALDTERTLAALGRLYAMGNLHIHADLIAGLPHEDLASFGCSFDAVYGKADVLQLGFLKLLHGTRLRRHAAEYGICFSPRPPYPVLQTDCLSFDELCLLEAVEGMVERFSNSGKFAYTFPYLPERCDSAFAFFHGLVWFSEAAFGHGSIARIPQTEAFRLVLSYSEKLAREGISVDFLETKERLALDFLLGESRRLPPFLMIPALTGTERDAFLANIPPRLRAGCEVVRMRFLGETPVIVDRIGRRVLCP